MTAIRSGIYAILDLGRIAPLLPDDGAAERAMVLAYARAAVDAGAVALQLRDKDSPAHSLHLAALYAALVDAVGASCPVLMNDHLVAVEPIAERIAAAAADAAHAPDTPAPPPRPPPKVGVHLGQADLSPRTARHRLGPDAVIGRSTHSVAQLERDRLLPVDYLGFGPIAATRSRSFAGGDSADGDGTPLGLDALRAAAKTTAKPVVAIGGLTIDDVPAVAATGARAMAVISAWLGPAERPHDVKRASLALTMLAATWAASAAEAGTAPGSSGGAA